MRRAADDRLFPAAVLLAELPRAVAAYRSSVWERAVAEHGLPLEQAATLAGRFRERRRARYVLTPGAEDFLRSLAAAGASPHDALMVGDDPREDVAGAAACGLRTAPPPFPTGRGCCRRLGQRLRTVVHDGRA